MGTIVFRGLAFLVIVLSLLGATLSNSQSLGSSQSISGEITPTLYGVGNNYAQGMDRERRSKAFSLVKEMGADWVKDVQSWRQMEEEYRVAKVEEAVAQAHSVGLKYFMVLLIDHPTMGSAYPTEKMAYDAYLAEFRTFLKAFTQRVLVDGIAIGGEMSGPQWWIPDGILANKNTVQATRDYIRLYKTAKAAVPPGVLVTSSSGDGDRGYVSGWATALSKLPVKLDAVAVYDYRFSFVTCPYPFCWGRPEREELGEAFGSVKDNITYYQRLFPRVPIIVTESGYHHGGWLLDGTVITPEVHADLYVRTARLAAEAKPKGFFFHILTDDPDSPAGILNNDLSPRPTYERLSWLLPTI